MPRLLRHRVVRASALRVVALVAGVACSVLIARLGGADVKGVTSAFATASILGFTLVNVDLAQQTLRHGRSTGTLASTRSRLVSLWPWYGALALLVAAVGLVVGSTHVVWLAAGALAYLLSAHMGSASTGLAGPAVTAMGGIVQQLALIVATLAAAGLGRLDVSTAPLLVVVSFLAPLPLYAWAARPRGRSGQREPRPSGELLGLLRSGFAWQGARVAQLLLLRLDTLYVFWFLGAGAAGVYSVGLATAGLGGLVPAQFASNATYEATLGRRSTLRRGLRLTGWCGLVGGVGLAVVGWPLLRLGYGREFTGSYFVMLAALPGVIAYGVLQVFTNQTRIVGEVRDVFVPSATGAAVMLVGLLALTPAWHTVGAAAASSLGAVAAVVTVYVRWRVSPPRPAVVAGKS